MLFVSARRKALPMFNVSKHLISKTGYLVEVSAAFSPLFYYQGGTQFLM